MKYDVAIIGGGLGGLECGYTLSKCGFNVCVLEQGNVLGGCLQTFKRRRTDFDTGFHYVGALDEGQSLRRLFDFFHLMDLPWHRLDADCFDEVIWNGERFRFVSGRDRFVEEFSSRFPHQRENLKKYMAALSDVGDNIFKSFDTAEAADFYQKPAFVNSAYDFLHETITDDKLRNVLAGTSLKMELHPNLPLYIYAQINDSFIQSAWRIEGGGQQIADHLAEHIRSFGGTVRTRARVTELLEKDGKLSGAIVNGGEIVEADTFISNVHPVATLDLVKESQTLKKIYRKRISSMPNTFGMFTANVKLKEGVPYLNRNQYIYQTDDIWHYASSDTASQTTGALVSYQVPTNGAPFADNVDILTPMNWCDVERWKGTDVMRRGADYEDFKRNKLEQCVDLVDKYIHGFRDCVDSAYTSTPLTYLDYISTCEGSAYGLKKDHEKLMFTMLTPRTPLPNLLLTGQNLNLHGVLGVSMTSFFTCAELIGMEKVKSLLDIR